ncbi:MAG: type II toxin-antitoxin system VapC family toxin [Akkermansiaceae bacterium]|nr:type II toxin-antitoxin system VapC family toxin [Akkermansiaceae bacterium]
MSGYADTGFLCSLYAPDAHSGRAISSMKRHSAALEFTWIHQLEFRNALRLRVFRREITTSQRDASLNLLLADLAAGILTHASPSLPDVMTEAERLSATHSEKLGTRSLDILHVAAALVLGSTVFFTFDKRQAKLGKAAGLKVRTP